MTLETEAIAVEPIDTIPEHATVRHYDELDEEIKERFPDLLDRTDQEGGAGFETCDCEVIKFVEYYRIVRR